MPPLPSSNTAPAASAPAEPQAAAAPVDVEAEAAALFSDEPKAAEPTEMKTIDFNCPMCDEAIQLPADLAGKRAQCPECKNIIKVPELAKKEAKDWRKVEARGPSGARLPDQPQLEGAWGSRTVGSVGKQSLEEAGVLPKVERPRTRWQKIRLPLLGVSGLLVAIIGGMLVYSLYSRRSVEREVQNALTFADSSEAKPDMKAALSLAAGKYYLRSHTSHFDPQTKKVNPPALAANKQFGAALTSLQRSPSLGEERDALLTDLALAEVDLGGDKPDTDQELRLPWDKTQQLVLATLREISNAEAKLYALRLVAQSLREHGQASRVLPLTNQLFAAADADKAAALSVVGLEFLKADDRASADQAADAALQLFPKDKPKDAKPLPLRAEVVTLALLLDKKDLPPAGDNDDDKNNEQIGRAEALARQGKWDEARKQARRIEDAESKFRAQLALAAAAVDAKPPETADIEAAIKMAEDGLSKKKELSWPMLRLVQLAVQGGLPEERVLSLASQIDNTALRGRGQLAVFRAQLDKANEVIEDSAADKIDGKSLARWMAAEALARHNVRVNPAYGSVVQTWSDPMKSFGAIGSALGLQDREK